MAIEEFRQLEVIACEFAKAMRKSNAMEPFATRVNKSSLVPLVVQDELLTRTWVR